ncbi:MAG: PDZ domain-containing protein, partial [Clostridia bacterium]|nr:PDZ domain-containing protein [Clostridia bacterium]
LEVVERSPASRLGLVAGDIIEAVNGRRVDSREEFAEVMESAGSIVEVAVFRRATGERLYRAVHRFPGEKLGIIMAPSRGDPAQVNLAGGGLLARWRKRNRK